MTSGDEKYLHRNFNNVLDRDLAMLLSVEIQPYISRVIASTCERAKLALVPNAKAETKAEESEVFSGAIGTSLLYTSLTPGRSLAAPKYL